MYNIGRIEFFQHSFEIFAYLLFLFLWELETPKAYTAPALYGAMASAFLPFR